jgi:hypothetical protein
MLHFRWIVFRDRHRAVQRQHHGQLGSDAVLMHDCDDPARGVAGLNFHDRADPSLDERSLHRHGCLLAAMLVVPAASCQFWIRRLEGVHAVPSGGRPNGSAPTDHDHLRNSRSFGNRCFPAACFELKQ